MTTIFHSDNLDEVPTVEKKHNVVKTKTTPKVSASLDSNTTLSDNRYVRECINSLDKLIENECSESAKQISLKGVSRVCGLNVLTGIRNTGIATIYNSPTDAGSENFAESSTSLCIKNRAANEKRLAMSPKEFVKALVHKYKLFETWNTVAESFLDGTIAIPATDSSISRDIWDNSAKLSIGTFPSLDALEDIQNFHSVGTCHRAFEREYHFSAILVDIEKYYIQAAKLLIRR